MEFYLEPIRLVAAILLASLLAFLLWFIAFYFVKPIMEPRETVLKTINAMGQETHWVCRGIEPKLWLCQEIPPP